MKKIWVSLSVIFLSFIIIFGIILYKKYTTQLTISTIKQQEKTITIIEGWNIRDIASYLESQELFKKEEFIKFVGVPAVVSKPLYRKSTLINNYKYLTEIPENTSLEGYLFPDTYRVYTSSTPEDIVRVMLANFDKKITEEMRDEIKKQNKSLFQIITMASIIEREVRANIDRAKVSDILWSRLKIGMPLQVDSSVNYITKKSDVSISYKDARIYSPYNTYRYKGMPLGPISNPGIASIKAAIYPEVTPYTYFLTTPDGEVKYGSSFEEHVVNKQKYLK